MTGPWAESTLKLTATNKPDADLKAHFQVQLSERQPQQDTYRKLAARDG